VTVENFADVLKQRNYLLHRWSIMQELYTYLEKFIDTDIRKAEVGITTDGDGFLVPQDLIIETRTSILNNMSKLMIDVKLIEQREVAENDDEEGDEEEGDDEGGEGEEGDDGE